ncbi:Stk1 family PASTA domain-containing Ser/Thr kinase [Actinomycetaceae bacterium MB13-C1-2]|nr:Stk1 family PASTA domain-containing Ser/Thr kinase [Actinomycetaceae bacterium MB13-C1-2]
MSESSTPSGPDAPRGGEVDGPPPPNGGDPLIGLTIDGRYKVVSRMARGGMASVYIAEDQRLGRLVALKIMHPHLAESEQFTARFRQEARSAAKISHPGVVPVYDQGAYQGQGYLVMELVDGPHLRDFVQDSGPLTLGDSLDITEQLLAALVFAHKAGVVHRDLKPENVLVASDGTLKITDFGLARAASEVTMSSTGTVMGTVAYLAPEVALRGDYDGRTDIYAVGIMLYELLTGTVPGQGSDTPIQLALSRVNDDIPPPSKLQDWIPTEVDNLTQVLAARDPADRPLTARDAAALVARTRNALPIELLDHQLPVSGSESLSAEESGATHALKVDGRTTWLPIEQNVVHTSGAVAKTSQKERRKPLSRVPLVVATVLLLLVGVALGVWWWWQQYGPGSYYEMPNLAGKTVAEAQSELSEMGIASNLQYENDDDVPDQMIIETNPAYGERVHKNAEATLIVSQGVLFLQVPDVVGESVSDATTTIETEGLTVNKTLEEWSETVPEGHVISTNPTPGTEIDHRNSVHLTVSKGREPIEIPDVLGQSVEEAQVQLEALALKVEVVEDYSDDYAIGQISAVSPAIGEKVHRGDTVQITRSLGSRYVVVPDVWRMSRDEAVAAIEGAGLRVEVNVIVELLNVVGRQSVAPGQTVERGTVVTIDIV